MFLFGSYQQCQHTNYIQNIQSVMHKPVFLMTVQEAHKEYNSLTDQIRAKFEQLDSGKFGTVDTPAFKFIYCICRHVPSIHVSF